MLPSFISFFEDSLIFGYSKKGLESNASKSDGSKCDGDHNKMVCGTNNVYCASTKISNPDEKSSLGPGNVVTPKELNASAIMLLQDVEVKLGNGTTTASIEQ